MKKLALVVLALVAMVLPPGTAADQASQPSAPVAGQLDVSGGAGDSSGYTCAVVAAASRCWGFGGGGRLGYANINTIGDDEAPGSVAPIDLGPGLNAVEIGAGSFHSCALLSDANVRCWGFPGDGRLGYPADPPGTALITIGDDETPGSAGPVDLGAGRTAKAISVGADHSCAILADDSSVRCWGFGNDGRLGYPGVPPPTGPTLGRTIGDNETPGSAGPVDLGTGRSAKAISAGKNHTCAILDNDSVRCWGFGGNGQLGYANGVTIGDDETPGSVGPVDLGTDLGTTRTAKAISAGDGHTCAVLDNDRVRCWGFGGNGRLGYGNDETIGNNETPGSVGPVDLGTDSGTPRTAKAISAGDNHSCAVLDNDRVRCWGFGGAGRLGYGNTNDYGDNELPGSVGPVSLGRSAVAISAGGRHTCVVLDDGNIRCWGDAATGRLGYCNTNDIGDNELPSSAGPVNLTAAGSCSPSGGGGPLPPPAGPVPSPGVYPPPPADPVDSRAARLRRALAAQARRKRALRTCLRRAARRNPRPTRRMAPAARRRAARARARARRRCLRRYGRTPGRVGELTARGRSRTKIVLSFRVTGTHGRRLPAARRYVVKQSRRPIRGARGFRRAQTLCRGSCSFDVKFVGERVRLAVNNLRQATTYYYAVAARDNVSGRRGRRSPSARARTRR